MAQTKRSKAGADQPITRHPLFPAIVALWSGALFGLGSILVSPATVEHLVQTLGIDRVIPMAAPPLGTTMRILMALGMTGIGAAIGGVAARRLTKSAEAAEGDADAAADAAPAEGETAAPVAAEPEAAPAPRRRRPLAILQESETAAATVSEPAPVPGIDPQILNVADFEINHFDEAPPAPFRSRAEEPRAVEEPEPSLPAWLDTDSAWHEPKPAPTMQVFKSVLADEDRRQETDAAQETAQKSDSPHRLFDAYSREVMARNEEPSAQDIAEDAEPATSDEDARPGFTTLSRFQPATWAEDDSEDWLETPATEAEDAAEPFAAENAEAEPEDVSFAEPIDAAPAFQAAANDVADEDEIAQVEDATWEQPLEALEEASAPVALFAQKPFAAPSTIEPEFDAQVASEPSRPAVRIEDADLDDLSPVELLERLALAMSRRREEARIAAEQAAARAEAEAAEPEAPADPEPAAWQVPLSVVPAALRPVTLDHDPHNDRDDHAPLEGYVPTRHLGQSATDTDAADEGNHFDPNASLDAIAFPHSPFGADDDGEEDEDGVLRQGYSSLLNLSRHTMPRQPAIRFEAPEDHADDAAEMSDGNEDGNETLGSFAEHAAPFARPTIVPTSDDNEDDAQNGIVSEPRPFDAPSADPSATEHALRDALATLRRMSGAA